MSNSRPSFHKLTPMAFKPISEVKLLPIQSLYKNEKIISEYSKGARQEVFKKQFNHLLDLYLAWGQEHKCQTPAVIAAVAKIKKDLFLPEFSGMQSNLYFESIKQNLEKILLVFQNEQIPLDNRKKEYARLCESFAVCGPGLHTHIEDTYYKLNPELSIERWLADFRTNLVRIFSEKHIKEKKISDGNSIHVIKGFASYATDQKWNPIYSAKKIKDPHASVAEITDEDLVKFHTYFEKEYSAETIRQCLQANLDEVFIKVCDEFGYKLNGWNTITRDYVKFMEKLNGVLEKLGIKLNIDEFCELNEESTAFRLDTYNIISKMGEELFQSNLYFDPSKKIFCDLIPDQWLNGKNETKSFDFTIWEKIPAKQFPSVLFKMINLITEQQINILLDSVPLIQLLEMVSNSDIYNQYLAAIEPEHRKDFIKTVIGSKTDLTIPDKNGNAAIHLAARYGRVEFIERLIETKADLTAPDRLGRTPAYIAAQYGQGHVITALAAAGIDLNSKNDDEWNLAHVAAFYGHSSVINVLRDEKVNLDASNTSGDTPLIIAVLKSNVELINTLVNCGADVLKSNTENAKTPLHYAIKESNFEAIKILLEKGANLTLIDAEGKTPLDYANPEGKIFIILQRIAIHITSHISKEQNQGIELILDRIEEANHNKNWMAALKDLIFIAAESSQNDIIKLLAEAGADLNIQNNNSTLAHVAATKGNIELLKMLVEAQADLNKKDIRNKTPLHYAVKNGYVDIVQQLVETKEVNLTTSEETWTNLVYYAVENGHAKIIRVLAEEAKANLDKSTTSGNSPLLMAVAREGNTEVIKTLIDYGVNVNKPSISDGKTPLHYAIIKSNFEAIKILLHCGANPTLLDDLNKTPLDYADPEVKIIIALQQIAMLISPAKEQNPVIGLILDRIEKVNYNTNWLAALKDVAFLAAEFGQNNIIKILAEVGANLNIKNKGSTLAHVAASKGNFELFNILVEAKADLNQKDNEGKTPLYYAVLNNSVGIIQEITARASDLDIADNDNRTPFNYAFRFNRVEAIKILLDAGANFYNDDKVIEPQDKTLFTLLLLEKYITYHWKKEECPQIISNQLICIKKSLDDHDYPQGLKDVINMAKEYSSSTWFPTINSYLKWFNSPDDLPKNLLQAILKDKTDTLEIEFKTNAREIHKEKEYDEKQPIIKQKPTESMKEKVELIKKINGEVLTILDKESDRLGREISSYLIYDCPDESSYSNIDYVKTLNTRQQCISKGETAIKQNLAEYKEGKINKFILKKNILDILSSMHESIEKSAYTPYSSMLKSISTGVVFVATAGFFAPTIMQTPTEEVMSLAIHQAKKVL